MVQLLLAGAAIAGAAWYALVGRHPGAFVSFASEDANIRDLFVGQSKHPKARWRLRDRSLHEPFSNAWKTQTREIIRGSDVVIVLVGKGTHKAEGAIWEVNTALDEKIPVFGVHISKDDKGRIPACMKNLPVIEWSQAAITREIKKATKKSTT